MLSSLRFSIFSSLHFCQISHCWFVWGVSGSSSCTFCFEQSKEECRGTNDRLAVLFLFMDDIRDKLSWFRCPDSIVCIIIGCLLFSTKHLGCPSLTRCTLWEMANEYIGFSWCILVNWLIHTVEILTLPHMGDCEQPHTWGMFY